MTAEADNETRNPEWIKLLLGHVKERPSRNIPTVRSPSNQQGPKEDPDREPVIP
jgi:hypothetical protein